MRIAAYVRVSTQEQAESRAGLSGQRRAIEDEASRREWAVVEFFEDAGYSARDLRRPGIQAALEILKLGHADALVVAKLDRLSRSLLDFAGLMARAQRESWGIVALDVNVDTSTPAGEAMANVLATFAQFERRLIGQRTREALAIKRAQGVRLGRPRSISDELAARISRERGEGRTLQSIADELNADKVPTGQGGVRWYPSTVRAVLSSASGSAVLSGVSSERARGLAEGGSRSSPAVSEALRSSLQRPGNL
jgi:DNA invertase Pin-like site-specific DNA recombinase